MKMQLFTQVAYGYFGSAVDAAIECYRQHGNATLHQPQQRGSIYVYYQCAGGVFDTIHHTGSMQIENYVGDQPTLTAFIGLSGLFTL